ncbi:MAG TPA: hypothetical protein VII06_42505 [Chloroflexota bacterium]|jgi:hypothetical protein
MSLLNWDYDDLARQVQHGLDRLSVSFFRRHGARVRRDELDFHGYDHVEFEVAHDGHRLAVRQYTLARGPDERAAPTGPRPAEEFESTFDGRPAAQLPAGRLARWLASLPAGEAAPEAARPAADAGNPFAAPARPAAPPPTAPAHNPFRTERADAPAANPFTTHSTDERRQEALDWLSGD